MALPTHTDEVHLRDYLQVLRKHRWLVFATFLTTVLGVGVWTFVQIPIYEAGARVLIDREPPRVLSGVQEVQALDSGSQDYYSTQYELIKSRPVMDRVIENLGLSRRLPGLATASNPSGVVSRMVSVEPKRNTRLVDIKVRHADPQLAADLVNGVAKAYVRFNLESKLGSTREAMTWLSEQMGELKAKLQDSEFALQKYREKSGIVGMDQQKSLTGQKMSELNRSFLESQGQRLAIEARLRELSTLVKSGSQTGALLMDKETPIIQKLKADSAELEKQLSLALRTYKEKHPEVVKIRTQLDIVRDRLREEIQNMIRGVETEYRFVKGREDALASRMEQVKREAMDLNEKEIQYTVLQRETQSNQQLYDVVMKRVKETGLSGGLETNNIRIVEEALVPKAPVPPRVARNIVLGLVIGLVLGLGLALFVEYFDSTIKTPDEAERYLGLPTLGVIPIFEGRK